MTEITLNESVAGPSVAWSAKAVLVVGVDISLDEARLWVAGGRARLSSGELPVAESVPFVGAPTPESADPTEIRIRRPRRREQVEP